MRKKSPMYPHLPMVYCNFAPQEHMTSYWRPRVHPITLKPRKRHIASVDYRVAEVRGFLMLWFRCGVWENPTSSYVFLITNGPTNNANSSARKYVKGMNGNDCVLVKPKLLIANTFKNRPYIFVVLDDVKGSEQPSGSRRWRIWHHIVWA